MTALLLAVTLTVPVNVAQLTPSMVAEWEAVHHRLPRWTPAPPVVPVSADPVERWRPLVAEHFQAAHVDAALRVIRCESEGNPEATHPRSNAAGLFQAMPNWYTGRGWDRPSPFGPFDPYDPEANVTFAAWLFYGNGASWQPWVCKP